MQYCIIIVDKIIMIFCSHRASFFVPWLCLHRKIKGTNCHLMLFHLCSKNQQEQTGLELSMSRPQQVMKLCKSQCTWVSELKLLLYQLRQSSWNSTMAAMENTQKERNACPIFLLLTEPFLGEQNDKPGFHLPNCCFPPLSFLLADNLIFPSSQQMRF